MESTELRRRFLSFFEERSHVVRPSASLIPIDPTLLLTNAGMVPFKPYFLGEEPPPFPRAVSVQKVVRTIDIDIIGTTTRHLSFFEMMGNFSFGDYFKSEAIAWAHELVTGPLGLDPERLWFTVYEADDEAAEIWIEQVGVPADRLQRGGKDNFWQMGVPGPCGPSSEIFFDKGPEFGVEGGPIHGGGEERYVEIWNLVFMQNLQDEPYHVVGDLPAKNIDTGMGLDRVAAVLQGKPNVFEIDTMRPVLEAGSALSGVEYGADPMSDVSLRILADHGRTVTFLIADGVAPSNEGRGHVLRRVLRRAVRHGWQLGAEKMVMPRLVEAAIGALGGCYPDLVQKHDLIMDVVEREESRFRRTLESGHQLLDTEIAGLGEATRIPGSTAFRLHDTFGFPIELTTEIAAERGLEVDLEGFEREMSDQRQRARRAWKGGDEAAAQDVYRELQDDIGPTEFLGYELESAPARVLALMADGEHLERAEPGRSVEVFLDRTPFYGESGGQVGDSGTITTETGLVEVEDTRHAVQGFHGHLGRVVSGFVMVGQDAEARIDSPRREAIRKSHTGTHVLHWALRDVIGTHAHQAGSLVEAGRLRFDFSHFQAVAAAELEEVERLANQRLIENGSVETTVTGRREAEEMGALAFFGDKYGERVRVVKIGSFSTELCGGTHTHTAAQVGPMVVTGESSIGSNLRRVEALTGDAAYERLSSWRRRLEESARLLRVPPSEVPARLAATLKRMEALEDQVGATRAGDLSALAQKLAASAVTIGAYKLVIDQVTELGPDELRRVALEVREHLGAGVVVLGAVSQGKGSLVSAVSPVLVAAGVSAAAIAGAGASVLGGGGSRDPELAQAGGPRGDKLAAALEQAQLEAERSLAAL